MHAARTRSLLCDVAVVGAGPAGSAAAVHFARAGLHVALLDRSRFPRAKACGDCLSPDATRVLDALGVLPALLAAQPARLSGWRIIAPGGGGFEGRFGDFCADPLTTSALAITRARLDQLLLDAARAAGAEARTGVRVTGIEPARGDGPGRVVGSVDGAPFAVRARLIVGADGLRSVVARRISAPARRPRLRKISLTAHLTGVPGPSALGEMHLARGLCLGLASVRSPVGTDRSGGVWNVTLVADADRFGRAIAADPAGFFHRSLGHFPTLRGRLDHAVPSTDEPGGGGRDAWLLRSGPFDVPTRRTVHGNVVLVGDAAGYYDPFTGQGIHQALTGAALLAERLAEPLLAGAPLHRALAGYAASLRRTVRGPRMLQRIIETVTSRPALADRVFARLSARPDAIHALLAATGDLAPAASLVSPVLLWSILRAHRQSTA